MYETLPKTGPLPGVVCVQWRRCGRTTCRCARGELHGPYFCRFWREGGRLKKVYVRRADVDKVRSRCQARRLARAALAAGWGQWRALAAQIREVERQ
ncbi:MAG: hypothetical protein L0Z62_16435 [Gemmataceae bacterium]|nr:hypothetical protein [Gemmataceae bacterium]